MNNYKKKQYSKYILINHIREYRIEKGFTQDELALLVGCSRNAIGSFERGEYEPTAYIAGLLAIAFNVKFEDLFEIKGYN